ncbi:hypothetical protein BU23DRAFT_44778 [Bimuria novae-zelandiae CBS 107.79]|uniref:Uncharacterized protein n=1 Tax=Bimuria novae-zelandiae CBS 107.79 TaxID=1447943 RepID=A0A6A5VGI4_9PLEO|nr:hypothetical protein BU23DRAFT_44778 [Bimuria novae-zelandiae CBS 107.79]
MENSTQEPYRDSPTSSRSSTPLSSSHTLPAKPPPLLPVDASHEPLTPYRDQPSPTSPTPPLAVASPTPQRYRASTLTPNARLHLAEIQVFLPPYTDAPQPANDDDVPLAQLYPYPTEAPPPYQIAVRESYRETLLQHIPSRSVSTVDDEESGVATAGADDERFDVEKVMAAIIVSMLLVVVASILALIAISGFDWKFKW